MSFLENEKGILGIKSIFKLKAGWIRCLFQCFFNWLKIIPLFFRCVVQSLLQLRIFGSNFTFFSSKCCSSPSEGTHYAKAILNLLVNKEERLLFLVSFSFLAYVAFSNWPQNKPIFVLNLASKSGKKSGRLCAGHQVISG